MGALRYTEIVRTYSSPVLRKFRGTHKQRVNVPTVGMLTTLMLEPGRGNASDGSPHITFQWMREYGAPDPTFVRFHDGTSISNVYARFVQLLGRLLQSKKGLLRKDQQFHNLRNSYQRFLTSS